MRRSFASYLRSLSLTGLLIGSVFLLCSFTPSLLPRIVLAQGLLSGFSLIAGYGIGVCLAFIWDFLEIPMPSQKFRRIAIFVVGTILIIALIIVLGRHSIWQNDLRSLMTMLPVSSSYPIRVMFIALLLAFVFLTTARTIISFGRKIAKQISKVLPRRISIVGSIIVVGFILASFIDGFVLKYSLRYADQAFAVINKQIGDARTSPTSPLMSGGPDSLIDWGDIGKQGKNFVTDGPSSTEIAKKTGRPAKTPLRIYAGYHTGNTLEERAKIALSELIRVGGFKRSILIVATPTGTGWLDPAAVDTVEILHGGDTAIVSLQYSYLPSWMTILIEPERASRAAKALFSVVYRKWASLPKDTRPKLYLHGLSLGALGSQDSADIITIMSDLIDGAVWSGPPFPSTLWQKLVVDRNPNSPEWDPKFQDGSLVRFSINGDGLNTAKAPWGPLRLVYLQHASDPMVHFSYKLATNSPDWLSGIRGPDVSAYFKWFPIVTFLQVAFDLPAATSVPIGFGHNYAPWEYIGAWVAVTNPKGWNATTINDLKEGYRRRKKSN